MSKYGEIREEFNDERARILEALAQEENRKIPLRLIGAQAFRSHCPQFGYIQDRLGRKFTDFDFVSYPRFVREVRRVLTDLGYEEDKQVTQLFGDRRMLFRDPAFDRHTDVFLNVLDFCHPINFVGRLEKDEPTVPLAELLLEKMQIVQINEKDIIDSIMLLREHPIGDTDTETINAAVITGILSKEWGFWRTFTANFKLLDDKLGAYPALTEEDRAVVHQRIQELRQRIDAAPKTLGWKARAQIGERVKWYKDVEELER